jgi:hypothetical protein
MSKPLDQDISAALHGPEKEEGQIEFEPKKQV